MHFEVEQKFAVQDLQAIEQRLKQLGARELGTMEQTDQYFNHPARDFAQTDEALRLRSAGDKQFITYKGPKLDATTKTRREIELPLAPHTQESFADMLRALGFRPVASVAKTRRTFEVPWQSQTIEVALDQVRELGPFVELELSANEAQLDSARASIAALAKALGVTNAERRSYLELLLAVRATKLPTNS